MKVLAKSPQKWFQNLQSGSKSRRIEGFKRRNIFNISSIESLGPTQELGLRGSFETTSTHNPSPPDTSKLDLLPWQQLGRLRGRHP